MPSFRAGAGRWRNHTGSAEKVHDRSSRETSPLDTLTMRKNGPRPLVLNRYELLERIGRGGFSTVYRARDHKMERLVAVKVVQRIDELTDRAAREARAAAKLSHPNIVTVFELAEDENNVYLVSELVEGKTLANRISSLSLSDLDCLEITLQVLDALGHAHERGVIHRDIKPDNIMLSATDPYEVKVMDFGIAQLENTQRITRQGDVVGTLAYMSPEQADGRTVDSSTDTYSTALTLYECLAGSNPFRAVTAAETVGRVQGGALPLSHVRPDLTEDLSLLVEAAMDPDPALRLDLTAFAAGIERLLPDFSDDEQATAVLRRTDANHPSVYNEVAGRLSFVAPRAANAALAALAAWAVVSHTTLYPKGWSLGLIAGVAVLEALLPRIGPVVLSAIMILPAAFFSPGLGVVLAAAAAAYYLFMVPGRPRSALLPILAAGLGYMGIGLVYPAAAGVAGRFRRGLALALLGAVALTGLQLASGSSPLDYLGVANNWNPAALQDVYSPWKALSILAEPVIQQPVLALQPVIWLLAALPAALLIRRRNLLADLSGLLLANALLLAGYLSLPYLAPSYRLPLGPFLKTFTLCVIIQFVLLLISPSAKHRPPLPHECTEET
ncbi:MAG TPA: serine/threonine protein kinase [Actinobacteria bacterium]|nr:serine/threonine protein kinase [Actinomycetota bacterium]